MFSLQGIFWSKKKQKPSESLPTGPIADAFKEYINNEIPARFIHTSNLQFVFRQDVFSIFQDRIAGVTEKQIQERIERLQSDPLASYQPRRDTVLREIIQEIVEYDIFSHHWDEMTGEPTFQDISSGKQPVSKFEKLAQFCETSRNLGHSLAWVDSCCIDQMNAAEFNEAIHGMYKWYANAYLCIVHLAESTSFSDWDRDSWFTQGRTLRELLAPKRVKFYDKDWKPFTLSETRDDDRKLADVITPLENASGIPKAVLIADNSQGVHGHTFWEIMSWASRRQMTYVEDWAHSLVGLFPSLADIREGQRNFPLLVKAIAEKDPSWDIFAWFGQPSLDHFALPSSPASYSGFEADLARDRVGVQKFTITAHGLSLTSLPPIPMELGSVAQPEGPGKPFRVTLKPRSDSEHSMGRFGTLVVECGSTRLKTIRGARQLAACVINHHGIRSRDKGKLVVGKDYICFLLYSEDKGDDETAWMKLTSDNLLRISCLGMPKTTAGDMVVRAPGTAGPDGFALSLVTISIQCPSN
ncbi:hypothetical protein OG21DRAFT_1513856 [Imleria badia]|nr:hypothetical protein OG21DRAFT_1513856 [Imleria badia]